MEIFEPLTSLLYNIGSASQGSGPSSWLPEIFGGGVSSMGDVFKNAVKTKIQENQQPLFLHLHSFRPQEIFQ